MSDDQLNSLYAMRLRFLTESVRFSTGLLARGVRAGRGEPQTSATQTFTRSNRRSPSPEWDDRKKSLLIESFLLSFPVPPLLLEKRPQGRYAVVDGWRRLTAIEAFLSDGFRLAGLRLWPELDGMRFSEFPGLIRESLRLRRVEANVILAIPDETPESRATALLGRVEGLP